jgi:hypothetical protein
VVLLLWDLTRLIHEVDDIADVHREHHSASQSLAAETVLNERFISAAWISNSTSHHRFSFGGSDAGRTSFSFKVLLLRVPEVQKHACAVAKEDPPSLPTFLLRTKERLTEEDPYGHRG